MLALRKVFGSGIQSSSENTTVQPPRRNQYALPPELHSRISPAVMTVPSAPISVTPSVPVIINTVAESVATSIFGQKISSCVAETTTKNETKANFGFHGNVQQVIAGPGQYGNNLGMRVIPIRTHQYTTESITEVHEKCTLSDFPASAVKKKDMSVFFAPPVSLNSIPTHRLGVGLLFSPPYIPFREGGSHEFKCVIAKEQLRQLSQKLTPEKFKAFVNHRTECGVVSDEQGNITQVLLSAYTLGHIAKSPYLSGIATIKLHENVSTHIANDFKLVNYDIFAIDAKFAKISDEDHEKVKQQINGIA